MSVANVCDGWPRANVPIRVGFRRGEKMMECVTGDEEVKSNQEERTYFEVVCPGMKLVDERWHGFLKGWFVGTIGLAIVWIIYSVY